MSMAIRATVDAAALSGALAHGMQADSIEQAVREDELQRAVQPESTSRHKGDCGR